jgi:hypothetical protein
VTRAWATPHPNGSRNKVGTCNPGNISHDHSSHRWFVPIRARGRRPRHLGAWVSSHHHRPSATISNGSIIKSNNSLRSGNVTPQNSFVQRQEEHLGLRSCLNATWAAGHTMHTLLLARNFVPARCGRVFSHLQRSLLNMRSAVVRMAGMLMT